MRVIVTLHRWAGGLIGLLLSILGLSGALLVWKEEWLRLTLPAARMREGESLGVAVSKIISAAPETTSLVTPTEKLGLFMARLKDGGGFYADRNGDIVAAWSSPYDRLELWLFDLHHYLLAGRTGETLAGIAGLAGLFFIFTGVVLWWRTRHAFSLRLWPKSWRRIDIIRQHRDLGVVIAPILALSMATGVMMTLRPVADFVLAPWSSPAEMRAATAPPGIAGAQAETIDWRNILMLAEARFPGAETRVIALPAGDGGLIALRMKQAHEWLPNGRTLLWFDPATAALIEARDAAAHPPGLRIYNGVYPVHAAKIGGPAYKLAATVAGLALAMLGGFAVWSFWVRQLLRLRRP